MSLEEATNFIGLMVNHTRTICSLHHTHPFSLPCKLVCFNLFHDRSDIGVELDSETLEWNQEKLEETQHLLENMEPPHQHSNTLAFPDLLPIYGDDSVEKAFDANNNPTPEFKHRVRSFAGSLISEHFRDA